jgi:hypothetical protein
MAAGVELAGDAMGAEVFDGDGARRRIDRLGKQHVITGLEDRQQRMSAGGEAGREQVGALAALDLGDRVLERERHLRAGRAVVPHALALGLARHQGVARGHVLVEHRRRSRDRRIYRR